MSEDKKDDARSKDELSDKESQDDDGDGDGDDLPPSDPDLDDGILKTFLEYGTDLKDDLNKLGVLEEFKKAMKDNRMAFEDTPIVVEVDEALKDKLKKFGLDKYLMDVSGKSALMK